MKNKNALIEARREPSSNLEEVSALIGQLSELDKADLLTHLVSQPMDRTTVGKILKAVAVKLTSGTLGVIFVVYPGLTASIGCEIELEKIFESREPEQKRTLQKVA